MGNCKQQTVFLNVEPSLQCPLAPWDKVSLCRLDLNWRVSRLSLPNAGRAGVHPDRKLDGLSAQEYVLSKVVVPHAFNPSAHEAEAGGYL